jgi:hypothetical protein
MYRSGDGVGFSAAGSSVYDINSTRMYINTNVGIGTGSPSYLLHLSGTAPELAFTDTDGSATWRARAVTNNFHITETGAGNPFVIESGAGANAIRINSSGNVGIGTNSPTSKLHIFNGDGSIPDDANNHLLIEDDGHSYLGIGGGTSSDTGIHFMDSGGIRGRIAYKHSSDAMDFKTANAVAMTINSSQNVGIGTTDIGTNYKMIVKRATNCNLGVGLQGGELSLEAFNDAITASVPFRLYGSEFNMLGGNVGIGTESPSFSYASHGLEIAGSGNQSLRLEADGSTAFEISARTGDILLYNLGTARSIRFGVGGGEKLRINSDGNTYVYQTLILNANNSALLQRDTGGTLRNLIKLDSANQVQIGDVNAAGVHYHYPSTYSQFSTDSGYLRIGPQNINFCHYTTDRANHWFNTMIYVQGGIVSSYQSDLSLRRNGGTTDRININANVMEFWCGNSRRMQLTTTYLQVPDNAYLAAGDNNEVFIRHDGNGHFQSNGGQMYINNVATTNIIMSVGNDEKVRIENDGDLHVKADVIAFSTTPSDIRLKENFTKIENGLDVVSKLEAHTFNWKKGGDRLSAGFKAQEVEKILPHLVDERELPLHSDDDKNYKVLRYEELIPYLVEAIKEQQEQINELKEKLNG